MISSEWRRVPKWQRLSPYLLDSSHQARLAGPTPEAITQWGRNIENERVEGGGGSEGVLPNQIEDWAPLLTDPGNELSEAARAHFTLQLELRARDREGPDRSEGPKHGEIVWEMERVATPLSSFPTLSRRMSLKAR